MLKFWITIDTDDDELRNEGRGNKTALRRILREAVDKIVDGKDDCKLMDINGNAVGQVTKCHTWHGAAEAEGYSGCTGWSAADVKGHYPELTDDEAEDYLLTHADNICDLMVSRGNDYIADISPDHEDEDEEDDE